MIWSFGYVISTGWDFLWWRVELGAPYASLWSIHSETFKLDVERTGTEFWGMILFGMCFTLQPSLQLWLTGGKCHHRSLTLRADQQNCTCLIGSEDSKLPWMCLVISPMQQLTVEQSSVSQGHALAVGENWKICRSCQSLQGSWSFFHPFDG